MSTKVIVTGFQTLQWLSWLIEEMREATREDGEKIEIIALHSRSGACRHLWQSQSGDGTRTRYQMTLSATPEPDRKISYEIIGYGDPSLMEDLDPSWEQSSDNEVRRGLRFGNHNAWGLYRRKRGVNDLQFTVAITEADADTPQEAAHKIEAAIAPVSGVQERILESLTGLAPPPAAPAETEAAAVTAPNAGFRERIQRDIAGIP